MMEDISFLNKSDLIIDKKIKTNISGAKFIQEKTIINPAIDHLIAEGGENFFYYLNCLGLTNEPNLLVLSSKNHYYYDDNEFENITALINLKKLNLIKQLDSFLHNVNCVLTPKTNFVGYFSDRENQKEIGFFSKMYKRLINFLDSKTDNVIDKKDFKKLLESQGFSTVDMTEINGQVYFCARVHKTIKIQDTKRA
jgi:hypothetical protein